MFRLSFFTSIFTGLLTLGLLTSSLAEANTKKISAAEVQKRIDLFDEIEREFKALRFEIVNKRSQDVASAKQKSSKMLDLAYKLPALFTVPSSRKEFSFSRSKPDIWNKSQFFTQQLEGFLDNLEEIDELLATNQLKSAAQVIDKTAQGCRRCHNGFRYK